MLRQNKWNQEVEVGKDRSYNDLEKEYQRLIKKRYRNGYEYYIGNVFIEG